MGQIMIDPDGTVRALYRDETAEVFRALGALDVERASHIEYDGQFQGWLLEMLEYGGFYVGPFRMRAEALVWEVEYLERRLAGASDSEAALAAMRVSEKERVV